MLACCCLFALLKDVICCSWRDVDEELQGSLCVERSQPTFQPLVQQERWMH